MFVMLMIADGRFYHDRPCRVAQMLTAARLERGETGMQRYSEEELRLLTEVLPNIARELRGAMANVYLSANRLAPVEARESDPEVDRNAALFLQSYYRMYRVVGNLTDAYRLAETTPLPLENGDIVGLVREVCERAEGLFVLQGVELIFEADRAGHIIAMNAELLERALLNLLSNALKFTPKGGTVTVRVKTDGRSVRLSVTDTGCGIAADRLESIFDRFLDTSRIDPAPHGAGLGLALCRRIAQGHGGTITVESKEGEGSRFTVALPNEKSQSASLRQYTPVYAGGFNRTLIELSDALGPQAFTHQYLD